MSLEGTIVAAKFVTGEEIIAKVVRDTTNTIVFIRPLTLVMTFNHSDQGEVNFAPWMIGLDPDAEVTIEKSKLLFVGAARKDAATEYRNATDEPEIAQASPPPARGVKTAKASR